MTVETSGEVALPSSHGTGLVGLLLFGALASGSATSGPAQALLFAAIAARWPGP